MTNSTIRIGARHWDHLIPLALGDVPATENIRVERSEATPDLWHDDHLDASETSLSKYVRARAAGDSRVVALPVFLMRAFRHRCIIVRKDSHLTHPSQLRGGVIGLTGWPDSGNTWTRAILREEGVGVDDAVWRVGRLTATHPIEDRIGIPSPPASVRAMPGERPLVDSLLDGTLDAVMTPFMPPGFHHTESKLRPLFEDTRTAERDYFGRHGYIPGIHVLGVRQSVLDARPELAQQLVDTFDIARRLSFARRQKLMDVTPWQNEEIAETIRFFGDDWLTYGWRHDAQMVAAFQDELRAQGLLDAPLDAEDLFPHQIEPTTESAA